MLRKMRDWRQLDRSVAPMRQWLIDRELLAVPGRVVVGMRKGYSRVRKLDLTEDESHQGATDM